jgi:peptidoglycan/xylan/chitin deacetylase (PgdA/CDA1 family)
MSNGILIISLDFELHWGGFEKWSLQTHKEYFLRTRKVIPEILRLFAQYGIHATWATVGMLFHESKKSLMQSLPTLKPSYDSPELSAYHYIDHVGIGNYEEDDPFHFAGSLIKQILNCPFQELGSHTFAHYYCNEAGQSVDQFREDLRAAQRAAMLYQQKLTSLVFPRNQFNGEYLKVCFEEGFTAVRDNPRDWFWNIQSTQNESLWKRINRGLDGYTTIGKKKSYPLSSLSMIQGLPICIPASRLLRPYRRKELILNGLKINHIKREIEYAAARDEVYHIWWHPHNFGNFPTENLNGLRKILDHFSICHDRYGMISLTMGEVAQKFKTEQEIN